MTDLHTHVLPGLDDGPQDIEESVAMVSFLAELGFDHIYLTPHFRLGYFKTPPSCVRDLARQLHAALGDQLPGVKLTEAHEVHLGSVFDEHGQVQGFLTFGSTLRTVLLELPHQPFPIDFLFQTIDRLFMKGIHVVLAHPERHEELSGEPARYRELCDRGVKLQVNVTSLAGYAGRHARKAAEALCGEGMIHAFGTDAHSLAQAAEFVPRGMRRAMKLLGDTRLRSIMECTELHLGE